MLVAPQFFQKKFHATFQEKKMTLIFILSNLPWIPEGIGLSEGRPKIAAHGHEPAGALLPPTILRADNPHSGISGLQPPSKVPEKTRVLEIQFLVA